MLSNKKTTLYEQALIEEKRRQLQNLKADFNPKIPYSKQLLKLMPNITLKPKQEQYINAKQFITWYLGGYKSGKTFIGVHKDIWLAYVNRPYPGLLVHPTSDGLKVTILPIIEEICNLHKIDYKVKQLSTKFIVSFIFGFRKEDWGNLIIASGDRPKSLKGPKVAFGHIDEPLIMDKEITQVVVSRVSEAKGKLATVQYTGTPEPKHMKWGFDIVDKVFEDTPSRFIMTMSTMEVQEYLTPGYVENARKNMTPEEFEVFINGRYRNLSQGKVYENFSREKNIWNALTQKPEIFISEDTEVEYALGYDFNVHQMSGTLWQLAGRYKLQVKEYRIKSTSNTRELTLMIIDSLKMKGYLIKQINGEWTTKYGRGIIITGDATGKNMSSKSYESDYQIIINEFEREKIRFTLVLPSVNPAVRDRTNYINQQFENGTMLISDECSESIRDRELMVWKLGATGFAIDKSNAEISHLSEAGDYAVWNTQMLTEESDGEDGIEIWLTDRR